MAGLCEGGNEPPSSLKVIMDDILEAFDLLIENADNLLSNEIAVIDRDIERLQSSFSPTKKKRKYLNTDARISRIVERYENYKNSDDILGHLLAIGHNIAGNF
ncbi:hypothetical protein ANN_14519 [Periplaneta americana]|uniref:Uncharacterized protein n=1 Tax=Periplaneta americana TaxID=6978 RepID=A0ABQ8SY41_PERAM|nr:hypothetical protein ANN_14519 [Periplaneta americana]